MVQTQHQRSTPVLPPTPCPLPALQILTDTVTPLLFPSLGAAPFQTRSDSRKKKRKKKILPSFPSRKRKTLDIMRLSKL